MLEGKYLQKMQTLNKINRAEVQSASWREKLSEAVNDCQPKKENKKKGPRKCNMCFNQFPKETNVWKNNPERRLKTECNVASESCAAARWTNEPHGSVRWHHHFPEHPGSLHFNYWSSKTYSTVRPNACELVTRFFTRARLHNTLWIIYTNCKPLTSAVKHVSSLFKPPYINVQL